MKKFSLLVFTCILAISGASKMDAQTKQPNIVWIIGDDWGQHASAYGTPAVNTPSIDRIANEGVKFTNTFTTAPVCSTMRSALVTGMYQTSIGAQHHRTRTKPALPAGVEVVTQYFQDAGYYTSNGNYNQSSNGKTDYNFSGSFGNWYDGNDWRDRPANTPFFSQIQIYSPHRGFKGQNTDPNRPNDLDLPDYYPDHELARNDYADYLADVESFDTGVGNVLDRLEDDGLLDNTIVMVFGDHGAPHVRDKQWLYDGGIRIPLLIRDPTGTIVQNGEEGSTDDRMLSHIDITATSLAAAGITIPDHIQGVDFNEAGFTGRSEIYAAKDRMDGVVDRARSLQIGDLKLIRNFYPGTPYMLGEIKESAYKHRQYPMHVLMKVMNGRGLLTPEQAKFLTETRPEYELYDLANDPNEFYNLADDPAYETTLIGMQRKLELWMIETGDMGGEFDPDAASEYAAMRQTYEDNLIDRVTLDATDYEYLEWYANDYGVEINLEQTAPDYSQVKLPNKSWDNTSLNDGAWNTSTPQGWSEAFSTVVQNMTANQMAEQSHDGGNVLILNSDDSYTRWAMDDNWGNLVQFEEALGWEIELDVWVGRRSDSQGVDAGILEFSLQNTAGDKVFSEGFNLDGNVNQGTWVQQTFSVLITSDLIAAAGGLEQLYLSLGNIYVDASDNKNGRVLIDDMSLTINEILLGDFDGDNDVDGDDYLEWQAGYGTLYDTTDLADWRANYGRVLDTSGEGPPAPRVSEVVPEPSSLGLTFILGMLAFCVRR